MKGVTDNERRVLAFVMSYQEDYGKSPTLQEIGDFLKCSRENVRQIVERLERKGYVSHEKHKKRTIRVWLQKPTL